jgi:hypothetical protein
VRDNWKFDIITVRRLLGAPSSLEGEMRNREITKRSQIMQENKGFIFHG